MKDNNKLWIALVLLAGYGVLVFFKFAESSGLVVLITYAVKKLFDMHEDAQDAILPVEQAKNGIITQIKPIVEEVKP